MQHAAEPMYSGDPSNCMACADDDFGKAFCSVVEVMMSVTACQFKLVSSQKDTGVYPNEQCVPSIESPSKCRVCGSGPPCRGGSQQIQMYWAKSGHFTFTHRSLHTRTYIFLSSGESTDIQQSLSQCGTQTVFLDG